jgi:sulfur-oxidizing protein SoxY
LVCGAAVPISVSTSLPDVTSIAFVVLENPNLLAAYSRIPQGTMP